MAIKFEVPPRTLLLCDYGLGGFRVPEMIKRRPVVVISPRLRHRTGLMTVVPLSTTPPAKQSDHQCQIQIPLSLPDFPALECWVKADMIATVAFERLELFRTARDQYGKRKYLQPKVSEFDFEKIKACIISALGL